MPCGFPRGVSLGSVKVGPELAGILPCNDERYLNPQRLPWLRATALVLAPGWVQAYSSSALNVSLYWRRVPRFCV